MNDTIKTIASRFSCRNFTSKAISEGDLQAIGDAAIQAPSAMNRQGWHITLVSNKALIDEIEAEGMRVMKGLADRSAHERIMGRGGKLFYGATAIAFIAVKDAQTSNYSRVDLGIVAQNVSLAAKSLGLDSCHCGMVTFCFMGEKAAEFKEKLKFPQGFECNYGVLLGYAKEQGTPHAPDKSKLTIIS